jgi:Ser-tRNA(Ala) deacylase AlaX
MKFTKNSYFQFDFEDINCKNCRETMRLVNQAVKNNRAFRIRFTPTHKIHTPVDDLLKALDKWNLGYHIDIEFYE